MGRIQFVKAILFLFGFVPFLVTGQNYPRFELYQLKQGTDSGQFIVTGLDSNLAFNNILRFRSADSTFLIGTDTVAVKSDIISSSFIFEAGLGIEIEQDGDTYLFESLSIEDSIKNQTGTLISKGTPLYATGVQGNYWTVAPADASDTSKMPVVVIAGEDIADGETGLGLIKGHIKQVNTTGLADGAEVYVAGGGGYTSIKPTAEGVIIQRLGTVIKGNSSNGSGIINLGDEAYWNDYTSLTKLRDTLVVFRDSVTNQIGDSLLLYVDRTELGDSLLLYVDRTELGDSLALYPNRIELGDTALAIRTDIPLIINDSLTTRNFLTEEVDGSITNELQTLSKLGLDITLSDGGGTVRDSILTETQVDAFVANNGYLTTEVDGSITNELQTISTSGAAGNITLSDGGGTLNLNVNDADASTTNEIQNISTSGAAGNISISSGSTLNLNVNDADASVSNEGSLTVGAGTASTSVISSNTSGSTDVTLTAGSNITLSETGNNITIAASGGGSSLWSEGATTGEIYYNSGNVGIGLTDPEYPLHVSGRGYFTDDLRAYDRIYLGGDFNHTSGSYAPYIDRYAATGETGMDFYAYNSGANSPLFRFRDSYDSYREVFKLNSAASTYQIVADGDSDFNGDFNIDGNLTQSGSIVQDGGSVTFNNTQSGSYDFGVGSLNHLPFMWVDASEDKMAVGGGTLQYTLDVTGDINFTGDLYDNGSLVSFGGGSEEYVFNGQFKSKTDFYIPLPSNVYTCTIDRASFVADYTNCSSCTFVYSTGSISSNTYTSSNTLWTYTPAGASGLVREENALSQTINSSNNVLRVDFTGTVTIDWLHTSIIVSCN